MAGNSTIHRWTSGSSSNRLSFAQVRSLASKPIAWVGAALLACVIGGTMWFTTSARGDNVVEGTVTNVAVEETVTRSNGERTTKRTEIATIVYQASGSSPQTITVRNGGVDEGDTPKIAFDPDKPGDGRLVRPLYSRLGIAIAGLGTPVLLAGGAITALGRRNRTTNSITTYEFDQP